MWLSPPQFAAQAGENNSRDLGNISMACHYPEVSPALACQKTEMFIEVLCLGLGLSLCLLIEISLVGVSHVYLTNFILWSSFYRLEREDLRRK